MTYSPYDGGVQASAATYGPPGGPIRRASTPYDAGGLTPRPEVGTALDGPGDMPAPDAHVPGRDQDGSGKWSPSSSPTDPHEVGFEEGTGPPETGPVPTNIVTDSPGGATTVQPVGPAHQAGDRHRR